MFRLLSIVPLGNQAKNSPTPCEDAGETNQRFSARFRPLSPGMNLNLPQIPV
jgi:hypothetical protein